MDTGEALGWFFFALDNVGDSPEELPSSASASDKERALHGNESQEEGLAFS